MHSLRTITMIASIMFTVSWHDSITLSRPLHPLSHVQHYTSLLLGLKKVKWLKRWNWLSSWPHTMSCLLNHTINSTKSLITLKAPFVFLKWSVTAPLITHKHRNVSCCCCCCCVNSTGTRRCATAPPGTTKATSGVRKGFSLTALDIPQLGFPTILCVIAWFDILLRILGYSLNRN